jgi:hypothetical protein
VALAQIDRARTDELQNRLSVQLIALNVESIVQRAQTLQGFELPPITVWREGPPGSLLVGIDGRHRLAAIEWLGLPTFGAYELLNCGLVMARMAGRALNTLLGTNSNDKERDILVGQEYLDHEPKLTQVVLARAYGISASTVSRAVGIERTRRRLSPDGDATVRGAEEKLSRSVMAKLSPIKSAPILRETATLLCNLPKRATEGLAAQLAADTAAITAGEEAQLAFLATESVRLQAAARGASVLRSRNLQGRLDPFSEIKRFYGILKKELIDPKLSLRDVLRDPARVSGFVEYSREVRKWLSRLEREAQ